jgi:hypothetical protein
LKFDGKEYPAKGPTVPTGLVTSAKRTAQRMCELTDKIKGKVMGHAKFELTDDGKTMTVTVHDTGQPNATTYVYDKM